MDWGSVFCLSPFHVRFGLIRLRCIFLIQATKLVITDLICDLPRENVHELAFHLKGEMHSYRMGNKQVT